MIIRSNEPQINNNKSLKRPLASSFRCTFRDVKLEKILNVRNNKQLN